MRHNKLPLAITQDDKKKIKRKKKERKKNEIIHFIMLSCLTRLQVLSGTKRTIKSHMRINKNI